MSRRRAQGPVQFEAWKQLPSMYPEKMVVECHRVMYEKERDGLLYGLIRMTNKLNRDVYVRLNSVRGPVCINSTMHTMVPQRGAAGEPERQPRARRPRLSVMREWFRHEGDLVKVAANAQFEYYICFNCPGYNRASVLIEDEIVAPEYYLISLDGEIHVYVPPLNEGSEEGEEAFRAVNCIWGGPQLCLDTPGVRNEERGLEVNHEMTDVFMNMPVGIRMMPRGALTVGDA